MKRFLFLWCLGTATLFVPGVSRAQSSNSMEKAKELYQQAAAYLELGKYDKALELFEEAYSLSKRPNLLYNIGLCHKYLHQYDAALKAYKAFLVKLPDSPNAPFVEKQIEAIKAKQNEIAAKKRLAEAKKEEAKKEEAKKEEARRIAEEARLAEEAAVRAETEAEAAQEKASEIDPFAVYRRPLAPTLLIGTSVLSLGGSVTTGILAFQKAKESKELEQSNFDQVQETFAQAKRLALVSDALAATTLLTGAAGAYLALRYSKKVKAFREGSAAVSIAPGGVVFSFSVAP